MGTTFGGESMKGNYFTSLDRAYVIAEIGVNHNGSVALAREMILAAKQAGADAVKFQTFTAASLVTPDTPKVEYQKCTTDVAETHYAMLERLELSRQAHVELSELCRTEGIDFLSTPYDIDSARFLESLGVRMFKTASADLVDLPLQRYIASTGKPAIVATGMSGLGEIEQVVDIFDAASNPNLVLLHCVSNYPCSDESLNLKALVTLRDAFGVPVGYSDHSAGPLAAAVAVALGAIVVEKHFTLDKDFPGPDHRASSTPDEFAVLVQTVRRAEAMLGSARKRCQSEERQMASVSRKSLVLARGVKEGEMICSSDLKLMRPGTGITAMFASQVEGRRARTDLDALHRLRWEDLEAM